MQKYEEYLSLSVIGRCPVDSKPHAVLINIELFFRGPGGRILSTSKLEQPIKPPAFYDSIPL